MAHVIATTYTPEELADLLARPIARRLFEELACSGFVRRRRHRRRPVAVESHPPADAQESGEGQGSEVAV